MHFIVAIALSLVLLGCNKGGSGGASSPSDSMSQQLGDAMVAIDDSGGSSGAYSFMQNEKRTFARYFPNQSILSTLLPQAEAATCALGNTWSGCVNNVITRNFQNCTVGGATFSGTVTITYNDGNVNNICSIASANQTITRVPNFTITGSGGGVYTVAKTGSIGQRLTYQGLGGFYFSNDGIRRTLSYNGINLADWTTSTTTPLTVLGSARNGRAATSGTLRVLNNKTGVSCDFTPSSVTWTNSCNCATSGSWSGSCSSGGNATYTISGCGKGTLSYNGSTENVTLDQCSAI